MVNFSKSYPFKGARAGFVLAWFIFRTQSRRWVRLPFNWVNAEWDYMSTESTRSNTTCQLNQRRKHQHLQRFHYSMLTQLTSILTPHWLSQRGVSLGIDSVDRNETPRQLSHRQMLKNLNKSLNSRKKFKTLKSFTVYVWSVQKTRTKKSHASVPLRYIFCSLS